MAPSKAELWDQFLKAAKIPDQLYKFGAVNSPNYLGMEDAVVQSLEGDHVRATLDNLNAFRTTLSGLYNQGRALLSPILYELARTGYNINTSGLDIGTVIEKISDAMVTATETVASRDVAFASVSVGGSNVSDGVVYRTTKDKNNNNIENGYIGAVKLITVKDKNQGAEPGREEVELKGEGSSAVIQGDNLALGTASAEKKTINFYRSVDGFLQNSSFDEIDLTTSNAEQKGWTLTDNASPAAPTVSGFTKITNSTTPSNIFRYTKGKETTVSPTGCALQIAANVTISQYVSRNRGIVFNNDAPYFLICRVMRKSSGDGTLTLRLGSQTTTQAISSLSNDTWADVVVGPGSNKGWYANFKEDWDNNRITPNLGLGVRVQVSLASWTTGAIIIDEIVLAQAIPFAGCFYLPVAGSTVGDSLKDDVWTFADAFTTGGVAQGRTQEVVSRLFSKHLPHTTGAETYADA